MNLQLSRRRNLSFAVLEGLEHTLAPVARSKIVLRCRARLQHYESNGRASGKSSLGTRRVVAYFLFVKIYENYFIYKPPCRRFYRIVSTRTW